MAIERERFNDRMEFLRAFLEIKGTLNMFAIQTKLSDHPEIKSHLGNLETMMSDMLARLEKDCE